MQIAAELNMSLRTTELLLSQLERAGLVGAGPQLPPGPITAVGAQASTQWGILFMGPSGAGKTQAIESVSEIELLGQALGSHGLPATVLPPQATVGMDVGIFSLPGAFKLRLYGAPGADRFDFMWDILLPQAQGLVLLLNRSDPDFEHHFEHYMGILSTRSQQADRPLVVGITHCELPFEAATQGVWQKLQRQDRWFGGFRPPVLAVDVRFRHHVRCLLMALVAQLEMARRLPRITALDPA